jgi:hypothetical protein
LLPDILKSSTSPQRVHKNPVDRGPRNASQLVEIDIKPGRITFGHRDNHLLGQWRPGMNLDMTLAPRRLSIRSSSPPSQSFSEERPLVRNSIPLSFACETIEQ